VDRLGVRLALAIGGSVALVILVVGLAVNATIASRFNQFVKDEQDVRREQLAAIVLEAYGERGSLVFGAAEVRRLAVAAGGDIRIYDADGELVARSKITSAATQPSDTQVVPLESDGRTIGRVEYDPAPVPQGLRAAASEAFRRALSTTLIVAGAIAFLVTMLIALAMGMRLTRPLGAMAAAAQRLGRGDLTARVPVPGDREGRELATAFNAMATDLERSEMLRRRAASDLAHEIATPVTVLSVQLDALADGVVPASPEALGAARDTAGEVARLVGDLHDLASAEGAVLRRSPEIIDAAAIVERAASASAVLFEQRGVALETVPGPPGTCHVVADSRQVERALGNLLTNAAAYTPAGGATRAWVTREGGWVRIRVADTGPGIPPEHQQHIFERFYRADPARSRQPGALGGTGIGLTVARDLARANGGDLRLEASGSSGTTFVLDLPAAV
jgi:two-component system sensor histidine kinase BaeS